MTVALHAADTATTCPTNRVARSTFAVSGLGKAAANNILRQGDSIDSCLTTTRSREFQPSACALSTSCVVDAAGFGRHRLFWFPYDLAFAGLLTQAWIMHVNGSRTWPIRRPVPSALVLQGSKGVCLALASHHALRVVSCPSGVAAPQPIGCYYYLLSRLGSTPRPGTQTNEPDAHGWGILPGQTYAKLMEQMRCGWGVLPGQIHTRQARG